MRDGGKNHWLPGLATFPWVQNTNAILVDQNPTADAL